MKVVLILILIIGAIVLEYADVLLGTQVSHGITISWAAIAHKGLYVGWGALLCYQFIKITKKTT
jgi:hypothetical protein